MDRRNFFELIVSKSEQDIDSNGKFRKRFDSSVPTSVLIPYQGTWGNAEVSHLLRRVTFGVNSDDVTFFQKMGLDASLTILLSNTENSIGNPLKFYKNKSSLPISDPDWKVEMGNTWIGFITQEYFVNTQRIESLCKWWFQLMWKNQKTIEEKMILFWRNFYAIEFSRIRKAHTCHNYLALLREYSLGNFREFTREMTYDVAMLMYLNGRQNRKASPDENYARELFELFTLGKGPESKYNQSDVQEAAKVLTGWDVNSDFTKFVFSETKHDGSRKVFSSYFDGRVINGRRGSLAGIGELNELLDMIFSREETAKYFCRRIHDFFVGTDITESIEQNVIEPLASVFRSSNYEVLPVLRILFSSEYFYSHAHYGCMVKSPVDFIIGLIRDLNINIPIDFKSMDADKAWEFFHIQAKEMGQNIADVPNVGGWPAYYQIPQFDRVWFTPKSLAAIQNFIRTILGGVTLPKSVYKLEINFIALADMTSNPGNALALVRDFIDKFLIYPLDTSIVDELKNQILLSGQENEQYWTNVWNQCKSNPNDVIARSIVETKIRDLLNYILNLEEYQVF